MAALANAQSYSSGMSLDEFKRELSSQTASVEDNINLLRSQFAQDPTLFDMGNHQSQGMMQSISVTAMITALTPTQVEMITLTLENLATVQATTAHEA